MRHTQAEDGARCHPVTGHALARVATCRQPTTRHGMSRAPWPDAPPARAELFGTGHTDTSSSRGPRSRAIAKASGSVRARSQPTGTRASCLPRRSVGLPRHATSRRAAMSARAGLWRTVRCCGAGCGVVFSLCGSCYRGQAAPPVSRAPTAGRGLSPPGRSRRSGAPDVVRRADRDTARLQATSPGRTRIGP